MVMEGLEDFPLDLPDDVQSTPVIADTLGTVI